MPPASQPPRPADDRLESWKEIAAYLKKGVRTVQRWERSEGLPVRRLGQDRSGLVFAYKSEIDAWWEQHSRTSAVETEPELPPQPLRPRATWKWWGLVAAAVSVFAALGVWKFGSSPPAVRRAVPITADHGWESGPAFSPDGRQIAYMWRPPGGQPQIYVKAIGSEAKKLVAGEPALSPGWSPDGGTIAFLRYRSATRDFALTLIPAAGGSERQLAMLSTASDVVWSRDGRWLLVVDGPAKQRSIVAVDVNSGAKHALTPPFEFGYNGYGLSPDSRRLIFSRGVPGATPVYELTLGAGLKPEGNPRPVTDRLWMSRMRLTDDGRHIVYVDSSWEDGSLLRLELRPGARPEIIFLTTDRVLAPAVSPNGQHIVFAIARSDREEIWSKSLVTGEAASPILSSTHSDMNPQYSPDGRVIAFHSTRTGASDIWLADHDGANPRRLTFTNARTTATPRWSPDGQWIAFESTQAGQSEVFIVASRGGPVRRLTEHPALDAIPRWSRDGRFIYFCSDRTGRFEVWKAPASGGQPVQVTSDGGFVAVESPDGRYLYYSQTRNYGPVLRRPMSGGASEEVIPYIRGLFFAVTARGIYFSSQDALWFWDAAARRSEVVYTPPKPTGVGIDVSPDEKTLLFTQLTGDNTGADLYLISQ